MDRYVACRIVDGALWMALLAVLMLACTAERGKQRCYEAAKAKLDLKECK